MEQAEIDVCRRVARAQTDGRFERLHGARTLRRGGAGDAEKILGLRVAWIGGEQAARLGGGIGGPAAEQARGREIIAALGALRKIRDQAIGDRFEPCAIAHVRENRGELFERARIRGLEPSRLGRGGERLVVIVRGRPQT